MKQHEFISGYLHPSYAESLSEFGKPRFLMKCGGWILERPVPGYSYHDAMGCYPLFFCRDWSQLYDDLLGIENDIVSLALVTDPFGNYDACLLERCFDKVIAYKEHFVTDLSRTTLSEHHRRNCRKALRQVQIERCDDPVQFIDDWFTLYINLMSRHGIRGIPAFSRRVFEIQLRVPGMMAFRAVYQTRTIGMILWYLQDNIGYYHLGAYSDQGYNLLASFALFWTAFEYFADHGIRWVDLGAGAGVAGNKEDGLSRFKRGWASGTRRAYFCGRILQPDKYQELAEGVCASSYFPVYRQDEFAGSKSGRFQSH